MQLIDNEVIFEEQDKRFSYSSQVACFHAYCAIVGIYKEHWQRMLVGDDLITFNLMKGFLNANFNYS